MNKKEFARLFHEAVEQDKPSDDCYERTRLRIAEIDAQVVVKKRKMNIYQVAIMMMSVCVILVMGIAMPIFISASGDMEERIAGSIVQGGSATINEYNINTNGSYLYYNKSTPCVVMGANYYDDESDSLVLLTDQYFVFNAPDTEELYYYEFAYLSIVTSGHSLQGMFGEYEVMGLRHTYNGISVKYQVTNGGALPSKYPTVDGEWRTVMASFMHNDNTYYFKLITQDVAHQEITGALDKLFESDKLSA